MSIFLRCNARSTVVRLAFQRAVNAFAERYGPGKRIELGRRLWKILIYSFAVSP